MIRKIIEIDENKCNGCGLCASACHEGAIGMINGKAKLLRDDYCDGLGNCLPVCPTGAISFVEREALPFDQATVESKMSPCSFECPGSRAKKLSVSSYEEEAAPSFSQLSQWPVQIKLAPVNAPYFQGANLLIAADCSAYACGNFHQRFMKGKVTLIGCPKLDEGDYTEKLTAILSENDIASLTVVRMEVPCCGGIEQAAKQALMRSGKFIPWQIVTLTTEGNEL